MRAARGTVLCALALLAAACRDQASPGVAYMPDMAQPVSYDAYAENPVTGATLRPPAPGTVARGARPFRYGATPEEAERAGRELANPLTGTPRDLARGQAVYETFCQVCHGAAGAGDGPVIPKFPNPPSYQSARLLELPDGQIYHVITRGAGVMPSYAAQIAPDDRWRVVLHVRRLQGRGPRPPIAPGSRAAAAPAPGEVAR